MAVITFLRNSYPALPVRDQLGGLARDLLAESLKTCARLTGRWVGQILQRLEAGQ